MSAPQEKIAIFVSGTGSNARRIIEHFQGHPSIEVALLISNKVEAPALQMAAEQGVETLVLSRISFYEGEELREFLQKKGITLLVLAGFLWLIPPYLVKAWPNRIVNIHPALLPKYGGKGMYGKHVHRAVLEGGERESGITIHYVNEHYDEGNIIFQARCEVKPEDRPETLARRVQQLEHRHFPEIIESLLTKK